MRIMILFMVLVTAYFAITANGENLPATNFAVLQEKGFVAAPGSRIDRATKLPAKIIHEASGIKLVLHRASSWQNPFPNLPEYCLDSNHPVVQVTWNDAKRFVQHHGLQLPTEAHWEYAVRAGSKTRFFWGNKERGAEGYGNVQDASSRRRFQDGNPPFSFDDGVVLLAPVGSTVRIRGDFMMS